VTKGTHNRLFEGNKLNFSTVMQITSILVCFSSVLVCKNSVMFCVHYQNITVTTKMCNHDQNMGYLVKNSILNYQLRYYDSVWFDVYSNE